MDHVIEELTVVHLKYLVNFPKLGIGKEKGRGGRRCVNLGIEVTHSNCCTMSYQIEESTKKCLEELNATWFGGGLILAKKRRRVLTCTE